MKPRERLIGLAALLALIAGCAAPGPRREAAPSAPLERLQRGNERFVSGELAPRAPIAERPALTQGQQPYAVVLTCADSRVAPELVFDESLGRLFVVRVAGNVVDPVVLGSVEYAVEHLHVPLLVIMGHDSCGAVKAALDGGDVPPNIAEMIRPIAPAVERARQKHPGGGDLLDLAVRDNVNIEVRRATAESAVLAEAVHEHKLTVVGAVYHLSSGRVEFLAPAATESH